EKEEMGETRSELHGSSSSKWGEGWVKSECDGCLDARGPGGSLHYSIACSGTTRSRQPPGPGRVPPPARARSAARTVRTLSRAGSLGDSGDGGEPAGPSAPRWTKRFWWWKLRCARSSGEGSMHELGVTPRIMAVSERASGARVRRLLV